MKKILIGFTALLLIALLFWQFWPRDTLSPKIENIKFAPERLLCERETPTAISLNYYANEKAGWRAAFAGRNSKDFYLRFVQFSEEHPQGQVIEFVFYGNQWKYAKNLKLEENLEFGERNSYSEDENKFLGFCIKQIYEYVQKREERKRLYTPVAFFLILQKSEHLIHRPRINNILFLRPATAGLYLC